MSVREFYKKLFEIDSNSKNSDFEKILDLSYKALTNIANDEIKPNPENIRDLKLSGNELKKFPLEFVNILPNLEELDLRNNKIANITNVEHKYQNIQILKLSENVLSEFPLELFNCFPNLKLLDLVHNRIASIPEKMQQNDINWLLLSENLLTEFRLKSFNCLPNLLMLNLSKNKIDKFTNGMQPNECIQILNLDENILTEFALKSFNSLKKLQELKLSNNRIAKIPNDMQPNQSIQYLNLSGNKLTEFPLEFLNFLPNLLKLDLSNNNIANITDKMQQNHNIKNINFSGNFLSKFSLEFFNFLTNLEVLDLSKNMIDNVTNEMQENQKINLLYIYLNNNNLREIELKFINNCPQLEYIYFNSNKLEKIVMTENLNDLNAIKLINCCSNRLNPFLIQIFEKKLLEKIDLKYNLEVEQNYVNSTVEDKNFLLAKNEGRIDLLIKLFEHNQVFINLRGYYDHYTSGSLIKLEFIFQNLIEESFQINVKFPNIKYYFLRKHDFQYYSIFFFLISNSKLNMENSEKMIEKCDELTKKFEKNQISLLDFLIEIKMDTNILLNLENKIKKLTNKETLYVEFNFFSGESIENLCERNDPELFDLFFPDKILRQNEAKLPYLINQQLFLENINFETCFRIVSKNENGEIATKLLLLYNLFRKGNYRIKGDYLDSNICFKLFLKLKFENFIETMFEKCDEICDHFEDKDGKRNQSLLDKFMDIQVDSKILENLENKIKLKKSMLSNDEVKFNEFNFFSGKSVEMLCERNNSELFDLFFPDKILRENEPKLPYLVNDQKFLSEINFERCFGIALENKNEEIATKLLLLYNLFRKKNSNNHEDYFSKDYISNFISLIKFFSESNSNRKLDAKPIRDLANDFWSPWKKTFYIGFVFIYFVMLIILSWKLLKKNSLNEQLFFKYENYLIILISVTDVLKFLFAFIISIVFLEIKLPIFTKNIISRCFYSKRNEQRPVERNENKTRKDDHPGNNIRFKDSKHFYSLKLFFELINSILLILAVLIYPKLISISIIFVFGVFIFKFDKCVRFGRYVRVLSQIIMKSIPFLIIFVVILFGFWISFHTLLIPSEFQNINGMKNSEKNESIAEKIIKFVIMGAGNLESDNFPIPDHNPVEIFSILFVYLTFIFSIPVIVINLFGGISNYEIKNMFDKAEIDDAVEKIQYSINLDKMKEKMKSLITRITNYTNLMELPLLRSKNRNIEENSNEQGLKNLVSVETIHETRF
ncbi:leucine rich repeat [Brachionus plicatilis]|uniref:Leucine rich repeat n=1 Tax=Brachionus plicatilis TaxID=10195 RepID=A0A3M7RL83_BRAPC|nr:leucine rich repeat [Brachionus plicatilis]